MSGKIGTVSIIGGDKRQIELVRLFESDGCDVRVFALGAADNSTLEQALSVDIIILPVPFSRNGETLFAPLASAPVYLRDIVALKPDAKVFGGMLTNAFIERTGAHTVDYYKREELCVMNAVPTAEGAVAAAVNSTDITLCGSVCLVVGYGRIGRALEPILRGFGADVIICARKQSDLAWISAHGCRPCRTGSIADVIGLADVIFNTVPSMVIKADALAEMKPDCPIIELASGSGGVDREAAVKLGVRVIPAPSLPGKVAPRSAAGYIKNTVLNIIREEFA